MKKHNKVRSSVSLALLIGLGGACGEEERVPLAQPDLDEASPVSQAIPAKTAEQVTQEREEAERSAKAKEVREFKGRIQEEEAERSAKAKEVREFKGRIQEEEVKLDAVKSSIRNDVRRFEDIGRIYEQVTASLDALDELQLIAGKLDLRSTLRDAKQVGDEINTLLTEGFLRIAEGARGNGPWTIRERLDVISHGSGQPAVQGDSNVARLVRDALALCEEELGACLEHHEQPDCSAFNQGLQYLHDHRDSALLGGVVSMLQDHFGRWQRIPEMVDDIEALRRFLSNWGSADMPQLIENLNTAGIYLDRKASGSEQVPFPEGIYSDSEGKRYNAATLYVEIWGRLVREGRCTEQLPLGTVAEDGLGLGFYNRRKGKPTHWCGKYPITYHVSYSYTHHTRIHDGERFTNKWKVRHISDRLHETRCKEHIDTKLEESWYRHLKMIGDALNAVAQSEFGLSEITRMSNWQWTVHETAGSVNSIWEAYKSRLDVLELQEEREKQEAEMRVKRAAEMAAKAEEEKKAKVWAKFDSFCKDARDAVRQSSFKTGKAAINGAVSELDAIKEVDPEGVDRGETITQFLRVELKRKEKGGEEIGTTELESLIRQHKRIADGEDCRDQEGILLNAYAAFRVVQFRVTLAEFYARKQARATTRSLKNKYGNFIKDQKVKASPYLSLLETRFRSERDENGRNLLSRANGL